MNAYIGGDRISYAERQRKYLRLLRALPIISAEWPFQCRCGTLGFVSYHGRKYCHRCGRRWSEEGLRHLAEIHARKQAPAAQVAE